LVREQAQVRKLARFTHGSEYISSVGSWLLESLGLQLKYLGHYWELSVTTTTDRRSFTPGRARGTSLSKISVHPRKDSGSISEIRWSFLGFWVFLLGPFGHHHNRQKIVHTQESVGKRRGTRLSKISVHQRRDGGTASKIRWEFLGLWVDAACSVRKGDSVQSQYIGM